MTAVIYELRDYYLKRKLERDAADLAGQLVEFAKSGGPIVEGSHPIYPNGIDDLLYETSMGYVPSPYDAG